MNQQVIDLIDLLVPSIPLGSPALAPKLAPEIGRSPFGELGHTK